MKTSLITTLFLFLMLFTSHLFSQIIGGTGNSELTPQEAEPSKVSSESFGGDVDILTGGFNGSVKLGTVSTPGGISYSLNLGYSSSFSVGNTQPMTEGIPYGEGWGPNIPTISIETDVIQKFTCKEFSDDGMLNKELLDYYDGKDGISGHDQGDLFWFSPMINIPGVGSGRAIFKYIDQKDDNCMVFVLNKFESPIEIRFYGNNWKVTLQDGTIYEMGLHLVNYRAPSNDKIIFYDQDSLFKSSNKLKGVVNNSMTSPDNPYGQHAGGIQNVIEPKISYSVWYCNTIRNPNIPLQGIGFSYEKFGKFNFFKEFLQEQYGNVKVKTLLSSSLSSPNDYSAYKEVFLTKVYSYVSEAKVDIIDLEYETDLDLVDNDIILNPNNPNNPNVSAVSNLYNKSVEATFGDNSGSFSSWKRYNHQKKNGNGNVNRNNPYLDGSSYSIESVQSQTGGAAFDHGFLESPRLFWSGSNVYPGDIYEINTVVSRNSSGSYSNGNGTIDIALVTGTLDNGPNSESVPNSPPPPSTTQTGYIKTRGVELFSTFDNAFKWSMGHGDGQIETSNSFVMPNFPSTYGGFNIQVGPGNSDIDYAADPLLNADLFNTVEIDALAAYPFNNSGREITSAGKISHNFGTGHPWSMMIPVYNMMALNSPSIFGAPYDPSSLYDTWWSNIGDPWNRPNKPTKFDEDVFLEKVELIRYSKNAYMLNAVKVYKVSGDYSQPSQGVINGANLVSQKKFEYRKEQGRTIKNYDYSIGDPIRMEPIANRKRIVILLEAVRNVPISGDVNQANYGVSDTSKVLTTFFKYGKLLDNQNNGVHSDTLPFVGIEKYVLNKYVDNLGGVTEVEYYPINLYNSPSSAVVDYTPYNCVSTVTGSSAMGTGQSFTVHPVVKYLSKSSENGPQVWHYKFQRENRMTMAKSFRSRTIRNNLSYFRGDFRDRTDIAFSVVEIEGPQLNNSGPTNGDKVLTRYEFYGNSNNNGPIDAYMFFGKPKSVKSYNAQGELETSKEFEYEFTKAFVNAYERPNPIKVDLNYQNLVTSSYEYEDMYTGELLEIETLDDNLDTIKYIGSDAYSSISSKGITGSFGAYEHPKFFTFYYYDQLKAIFPDYMFHSYFIKTKSITERVYEDGLSKNITYSPAPDYPAPLALFNPHGSGFVNDIVFENEDYDILVDMIDWAEELDAYTELLERSPLSDNIMLYLINSSMDSKLIADILTLQGGLSNEVFKKLFEKRKNYPSSPFLEVIDQQTYFSDDIQLYVLNNIDEREDFNVIEAIFFRNNHLSTDVISELISNAVMIPSYLYENILRNQRPQPYSIVEEIINSNVNVEFSLSIALSNQSLNNHLYEIMIDNSFYNNEIITSIIETGISDPSDDVLINLLNRTVPLTEGQLTRVFEKLDRLFGTLLVDKLHDLYSPLLVDFVLGNQLKFYCENDLIENRTYIENKKEFDYYEANFEGKAIGKAYEMLFGFISSTEEPSAFPMTIDVSDHSILGQNTKEVKQINLKHEPSWQLFSVTSSSPHQTGAYNKSEKYYLYDLQNRYDRHWYHYDFDPYHFNFTVDIFTVGEFDQEYGGNDTLVLHYDYYPISNEYYPIAPRFDGMNKSREYNIRTLVFQDVSISKNSRSDKSIINSSYYRHDSRWDFDVDYENTTAYYDGDACAEPLMGGGCVELECFDCYQVFPTGNQSPQDLVPSSYCLWFYSGEGYFVCPSDLDLGDHGYTQQQVSQVWCNIPLPPDPNDPTFLPPLTDLLSKTLQLRSVYVQVDTLDFSIEQEFNKKKWDQKNKYIAEFFINLNTTDVDEYNSDHPYEIVLPFENLRNNHTLERNNYFQTALEENQVGLQTKYYYFSPIRTYNVNNNCSNDNYTSMLIENIGQPTRICVGYNLEDSLSTGYSYNGIGQIESIFLPDGQIMAYEYDDYNRLTKKLANYYNNVLRELNQYEYNYWDHNFNTPFEQRTNQNSVKTTIFNSDNNAYQSELDQEIKIGFIDPLGREFSSVTSYLSSLNNRVEIHSGTVQYDAWNRGVKKYKNYLINNPVINAIQPNSQTSTLFEKVNYESSSKSRALRSSNFGVDVSGIHAIKNEYYIANYIFASCELELSKHELNLIMRNGVTSKFKFYRTVTFDQDDKKTIGYTNAFGQKVATLQFGENNQKIVTLFVYDDYGNLTKTINPKKQETDYIYNSLGLMVEEKSIDAGSRKFMYNKHGLVSHIRTDQLDDFETGPVKFYTRSFKYDEFGRLKRVGRSPVLEDQIFNGRVYDGFYYESKFIGAGIDLPITTSDHLSGEFYFEYEYSNASSLDWLNRAKILHNNVGACGGGNNCWQIMEKGFSASQTITEKSYFYGDDVNTNKIGKLILNRSFDATGVEIQSANYNYDDFGNISDEEITFNPNNVTYNTPSVDIVSKIEYPRYNYRGSLLEEQIDVNGDGTVDFHCFMDYDALNRIVGIYASIGEVTDDTKGTLVVSYEYDDATGAVKKKTHQIANPLLPVIANEIAYSYDQRNRLTNITAQKPGFNPILDYDLFYDDQTTQYSYGGQTESVVHNQNWNGNINGTSMNYNFNSYTSLGAAPSSMIKPLLYGFTYDPLNRMTRADATVGDFLLTGAQASESYQIGDLNVGYDKIGNIHTLRRTLLNTSPLQNAPYLAFDHFHYNYHLNNRLYNIGGASGSASRTYGYDDIGNLVSDGARDITDTKYARASYPFNVKKGAAGTNGNIDYLYSIDDQRIYKYHSFVHYNNETYYLRDAFGRNVAIYNKLNNVESWTYFVSGSERECEITPHGNFTPFTNSGTSPPAADIAVKENMAKFYLYDHLGNTRITYTPTGVISSEEKVNIDEFLFESFDDWQGEVNSSGVTLVGLQNINNSLEVTVDPQATLGVSKEITYLQGGQSTYDIEIDVDLGTTSGLEMNITNVIPSTFTLSQGMNTFSITPSNSSSIISILPINTSQTHTFTINSIEIIKQYSSLDVTKDDIERVVDYYPYGKVLREEVLGDGERFLTTQHERDQSTGLDYRGARYYDSDVARFLSLDPLASQFPSWSDYNYVMGNPLMFIDPDGRAPQDWVKSFETGEYTWDESAKDQNSSPAGTRYIGPEDSDIVKDLFGQTNFKSKVENSGIFETNRARGGFGSSHAKVITELNVNIRANVTGEGDNRTFNGIDFIASSGGHTNAVLNSFQKLEFNTSGIKFNGVDMESSNYDGPKIDSQAGSGFYNHSWSANRVNSDFGKSYNRKVSLDGGYTFGGSPLKEPTMLGLILPFSRTSMSVTLPFNNN